MKTLTIEPVTRIEGHAKISILLDEAGGVADARFHVTEFRGFEKFCVGRSFWEMPGITARICGICPVSHALTSSKAGDAILGVAIPPVAEKLRRLMNWAQLVQSHALSFFHLSGPDLLLGMESNPAKRHIFGLAEAFPEVARDGILLRKYGQEIIRILGERSVHPTWAIPGGVLTPLSDAGRDQIAAGLPAAMGIILRALDRYREVFDRHADQARVCGDFPSLFLGLVTPEGGLDHYGGALRLMEMSGRALEDHFDPARYAEIFGEGEENWTYLKFPYYKPLGCANGAGIYRVGPLARLNVADFAGTPLADRELRQFRRLGQAGGPVTGSFHYHQARLIEILFALEKIGQTLDDPELTATHVRSQAGVNSHRGIAACEAPRGTLFHDYEVDENGILTRVNLLIATGQNNLAMNRTVLQIAKEYLRGDRIEEGLLNRVEHGIRAYDPCLSCATHALGKMPLEVELLGPAGERLDHWCRGKR